MLLVVFLILFEDLHLHGKRFIFWVWRHMMLICNLRYTPISTESRSDIVKVHSTAVLCINNQIKDMTKLSNILISAKRFKRSIQCLFFKWKTQSLNPQYLVFVEGLVGFKSVFWIKEYAICCFVKNATLFQWSSCVENTKTI